MRERSRMMEAMDEHEWQKVMQDGSGGGEEQDVHKWSSKDYGSKRAMSAAKREDTVCGGRQQGVQQ